MIYGIDIGPYTKKVDWPLLKAKGIEFAVIKATQGDTITNKLFGAMAEGAKAAGLVVGLYQWCDPLKDAKKQADYFLDQTCGVTFDFAAVDLEQYWADWSEWPKRITKKLTPEKISSVTKATVQHIQNGMREKRVLVYTRASFIHDYAMPATAWLKDWPLWVAHWAFNPGKMPSSWEALFEKNPPYELVPALPKGCAEWVLHQWSGDKFVLPGMYDIAVDLDSFDGTVKQLREYFGLEVESTKGELLKCLEEKTDLFISQAIELEAALQAYIASEKG